MAAVLCKISVGRPGVGAANASYITRLSALNPTGRGREDDLSPEYDREDDPLWTWNAPTFLTGESHGIRKLAEHQKKGVHAGDRQATGEHSDPNRSLTLGEKVENVRTYFGSKESVEKAKGGRTHYRAILSFDVPATNKEIKELTNKFLEQTFPKAKALAAIHRDTEHPHVHLYIHSRQIDGKRIQLKHNDYRTLDEKWADIYAGFAGDRSVSIDHLRKKRETEEWKRIAAIAYQEGKPVPPKPERDADRRERLAEQRLSALRSKARDLGRALRPRPAAQPVIRPRSEKETGRLIAKEHLARERLAHLVRTDASHKEIEVTARTAQGLSSALEGTVKTREEIGKGKSPGAIYTVEEGKMLAQYRSSCSLPAQDTAKAARLVAHQKLSEAELVVATRKSESFQTRRHLWRLQVEGWDKKLSLKDVEQALKEKQLEKLGIFNFFRPSKRATIKSHIEYLAEVKNDIQKQLAAYGEQIEQRVKTAELKHKIVSAEIEQTRTERASAGEGMPGPRYSLSELQRVASVANRNLDANLLQHVHEITRDSAIADRETASIMVGRSLMARLEMLRAEDRLDQAIKYAEGRKVSIQDAQGRDHAVSLREVQPRTVAEVITNQIIRSPEEKFSPKEVRELAREQVRQAERDFERARQYYEVRRDICAYYCQAADVREDKIAATLTVEQIREIREYSSKLPEDDYHRRQFEQAIPRAERDLRERKAAGAAPQQDQKITEPGRDREPGFGVELEKDRTEAVRDRDSGYRGR